VTLLVAWRRTVDCDGDRLELGWGIFIYGGCLVAYAGTLPQTSVPLLVLADVRPIFFQDFTSHPILRHMHRELNRDENKN
jgi:hypothetical protein